MNPPPSIVIKCKQEVAANLFALVRLPVCIVVGSRQPWTAVTLPGSADGAGRHATQVGFACAADIPLPCRAGPAATRPSYGASRCESCERESRERSEYVRGLPLYAPGCTVADAVLGETLDNLEQHVILSDRRNRLIHLDLSQMCSALVLVAAPPCIVVLPFIETENNKCLQSPAASLWQPQHSPTSTQSSWHSLKNCAVRQLPNAMSLCTRVRPITF